MRQTKSPPVHHRRAPVSEANQRIPVHPWKSRIGNLLIDAKVLGAGLAAHRVLLRFERDLLTFVERAQTCTFDGADVDENVGAAIIGLNEAKAIGAAIGFSNEPRPASSVVMIPYISPEIARCATVIRRCWPCRLVTR